MKDLIDFISNPLVIKVVLGYWVYSAFVGAMPSPDEFTGYVQNKVAMLCYRFVFGFLHGISGNLNRAAIAFKVPGAKES